jgi:serine O-acetyltransferase
MIRLFALLLYLPHVFLFLLSKQKETIRYDLYSRSENKLKRFIIIGDLSARLFYDKYFRTLFYFRLNNFPSKILRVFYPKERYFIIDIHTVLGKGVQLAHPYSTILNAEHIGENLYVNHLVTVGEKHGRKPRIGNNVQLHANCIVIGGIEIGDNAIIGAGSVVVKNVPENAIVVGNPGKIIGYNV